MMVAKDSQGVPTSTFRVCLWVAVLFGVVLVLVFHPDLSEAYAAADPANCRKTSEDILGPFYIPPMPSRNVFCTGVPGYGLLEKFLVHGYVLESDCFTPIRHAYVEVWQADQHGNYTRGSFCKGHLRTDINGHYSFITIKPGKYFINPWRPIYRPAHIHFRVYGRQGHKGLVTQMYFPNDSNLGVMDGCAVCKSENDDLLANVTRYCNDDTPTRCATLARFDLILDVE